ncbi:hypothetical protein [Geopsychrobacter electrodiphilus]|uniref:hypothetical protein n=1 Tax=Geopsychrobacter electrodiphilus TaxID=225196 RepID=UPI0003665238|nr:hypothetical protein [Geopsychrobacter electrodiphilus]
MNVTLKKLKRTIGAIISDIDTADFNMALDVRTRVSAVQLLLDSSSTPQSFLKVMSDAYLVADNKIKKEMAK